MESTKITSAAIYTDGSCHTQYKVGAWVAILLFSGEMFSGEKDRQLLREINVALAKIRDGTYGICEGTGKPITKARLEAKPWAKYSIEYARKMESRMMGSR